MSTPKLGVFLTEAQWSLVLDVLDWEDAGPSEIREQLTKSQSDALDRAREAIRAALKDGAK